MNDRFILSDILSGTKNSSPKFLKLVWGENYSLIKSMHTESECGIKNSNKSTKQFSQDSGMNVTA